MRYSVFFQWTWHTFTYQTSHAVSRLPTVAAPEKTLSSPASAQLEQALVLPIDHVSNFEWPGPEVAHQLSWSHGVSTSMNHGNRVIPTSSQPHWPGYTNHNGMVQQYPILFCIVVGITRSGVEFRSWISSWPGGFLGYSPPKPTNQPRFFLGNTPRKEHTPDPQPTLYGSEFLSFWGLFRKLQGYLGVLLDRWIFPWPKGIEIKFSPAEYFLDLDDPRQWYHNRPIGRESVDLHSRKLIWLAASWKIHYFLKMEIQIFIHGDKFPATCGPC